MIRTSIRQHLQRWILSALAVGSVCLLLTVYHQQRDEFDEIFNENLKQMAIALALQAEPSSSTASHIPHNLPTFIEEDDGLNFVAQVFDKQGQLINSSQEGVQLTPAPQTGLTKTHLQGEDWFIYTVQLPQGAAVAGQKARLRQLIARESLVDLLGLLLLLLVFMAILVQLAVRRGLQPLEEVALDISQRSAQSLAPLNVKTYPKEVQTIAVSINTLMTRLGQALQVQQRFIADAAHELRTPVAALRLQLQLLQRATTVQRSQQAQLELAQGIARTERLVLQLLDLSRIEPNQDQQAIPIQALCLEILDRYQPIAKQKNIVLEDNLSEANIEAISPSPSDWTVRGNTTVLSMMISNLVDNAIRYTPPNGHIELQLLVAANHIQLNMSDSGPGIAPEERQRVFDRFYRINHTPDDEQPTNEHSSVEIGSGIGLAIVRQAVEQHRGTIDLQTSPMGGLKVLITLPLETATTKQPPTP